MPSIAAVTAAATATTLITGSPSQQQDKVNVVDNHVDDDGCSCSTGASTVRASNVTVRLPCSRGGRDTKYVVCTLIGPPAAVVPDGMFVALPPQRTSTHLQLHCSPSNNMSCNSSDSNNNPVDQWSFEFGQMIGLFRLTKVEAEAFAVIVRAAATEDVNAANTLMGQWINDHVVKVERRPFVTFGFQERLTLYLNFTDEERDQVRTRLLRPSAVTHTAQDEDAVSSITSGSPPVRGVAGHGHNQGGGEAVAHLPMVDEEKEVVAEDEAQGEAEGVVAEAPGEVLSTAATTGARTVATVAAAHDVTAAVADDDDENMDRSRVGEELSDLLEGVDLSPLENLHEESSSKAASSTMWSTNASAGVK